MSNNNNLPKRQKPVPYSYKPVDRPNPADRAEHYARVAQDSATILIALAALLRLFDKR